MAEILLRRGSTIEWLASNPVLKSGEPGFDRTKKRLKIGDGVSRWQDLPYLDESSDSGLLLNEHINDETPHPAYDDAPSLAVFYENAKV